MTQWGAGIQIHFAAVPPGQVTQAKSGSRAGALNHILAEGWLTCLIGLPLYTGGAIPRKLNCLPRAQLVCVGPKMQTWVSRSPDSIQP